MATANIVYASMTGNTEELAEILTDQLEDLDINVTMDECTQVEASDFLNADACIVAVYTYSDGELPEEILDFYDELQTLDLSNKYFAVMGSGDTFYENYCTSVDDFATAFKKTGATQIGESIKVDLAAEDEDVKQLENLAENIAKAIKA